MHKFNLLLVIAGLVILSGGNVNAEDWKVGEKWTYKHEGPRPYADPSAMVKGDRTVEVTAINGEGQEKQYLLKNMWGSEDANPSTSYIDSKNMLHKIDIEYMFTLLVSPPVPVIWPLKPGEEKILKTKLEIAGMSIPIEYVAKRMKDEAITVPAGRFENCQYVQIISSLQNETGQTVKNKEEYWYHPKVRNLVKGVIITNYQSDNSYISTNLLKSHTKKD
ncbi:MAG: hypothetical protein A2Z25_08155 [Planctomycetes bacterium RBG_16_55_9]|nr:MAG: hypothetical protein A2Z25_08155 [Planctomycetes bacterium RBG_16_55_9]